MSFPTVLTMFSKNTQSQHRRRGPADPQRLRHSQREGELVSWDFQLPGFPSEQDDELACGDSQLAGIPSEQDGEPVSWDYQLPGFPVEQENTPALGKAQVKLNPEAASWRPGGALRQ